MSAQSNKELRLKGGARILGYISQFSATEKVVFGALIITALATSLLMAQQVNSYFLTEVPNHGGELREGIVGLPRTINPVLAVTDADHDLSALVYSGLTAYRNNALVPDLASSWNISTDGLTYTFDLRDDASFQDGKPLTADDVAFTIQKIQDPALKSPHQADWTNVAVKVLSPTRIQFSLKQPYAPFLNNTAIGIMPKHIWGSVSDDQFIFSQYNIEPIGSGPYKIASIVRDQGGIPTQYRLDAASGYYGAKPYIGSIAFYFYGDQAKALSALDQGYIDSLAAISPGQGARLSSDSAQSYTVVSTPLPRIFGVFFNQNQNQALADRNVRIALDMAVDRKAILDGVLKGYGSAIHGPLPAGMNGATSTVNDSADLDGAQALLEKNGWKKGSDGIYAKRLPSGKAGKLATTTLSFDLYTADTPDLKTTADLVVAQWKALGAQVDIKVFEAGDLYQNVIRTRTYDALLFGELIGKDRDLYAFWHSSQRTAPGLNVALYANSKVDKLLETIRSTSDDGVRQADYKQVDQLIRADAPAIFLYAPDFIYAIPKTLKGMSLGSVTTPADRWNSVADWYVATEQVWKVFAKR